MVAAAGADAVRQSVRETSRRRRAVGFGAIAGVVLSFAAAVVPTSFADAGPTRLTLTESAFRPAAVVRDLPVASTDVAQPPTSSSSSDDRPATAEVASAAITIAVSIPDITRPTASLVSAERDGSSVTLLVEASDDDRVAHLVITAGPQKIVATARPDGLWEASVPSRVLAGARTVWATAIDPAGNVATSAAYFVDPAHPGR